MVPFTNLCIIPVFTQLNVVICRFVLTSELRFDLSSAHRPCRRLPYKGSRKIGPRTVGPGAHLITPPNFWHKNQDRIENVELYTQSNLTIPSNVWHQNQDEITNIKFYTNLRNCALPPQGPTADRAQSQPSNLIRRSLRCCRIWSALEVQFSNWFWSVKRLL